MGDVAAVPESALVAMLGPAAGRHLHALARNVDPRSVTPGKRRRSIGAQRALGRRPRTRAELDDTLLALVERVTERLRTGRRVGRTVTLRLRHADLSRETRSRTLSAATDRTDLVLATARDLLDARWPHLREAGCTLIGVTVSDLAPADAVQLTLDLDGHDRRTLDHTLDAVRDRFGGHAVTRASLLGQGRGAAVPMLPDPLPDA